ncbi:hypothetical protein [Paraburkholderia elongata]|uniref:Uncharacterized protein n=1 Tax=Paraburkholderia elongata TaxID=2675747 RepID=A0A972SQE5_9BURK|nr:hypothetical protein [Paraburkholderia elongata]NPT59715.1 hypothetical protein [Paraburkholderia elongata]
MSSNATETPSSAPALLERFELWAREEEGLQESMFMKHPLPDQATYLDRVVDGMWRGFKGYHEMVQRGDACGLTT